MYIYVILSEMRPNTIIFAKNQSFFKMCNRTYKKKINRENVGK